MKAAFLSFAFSFLFCSISISAQTYTELDVRIQEHYTQIDYNQIVANNPTKLDKIIFYYTSSFQIINPNCENCMIIHNSDIDVTDYEHHRLQSTRMKVGLNRNGDQLELLSRDELEAQYQQIENQ